MAATNNRHESVSLQLGDLISCCSAVWAACFGEQILINALSITSSLPPKGSPVHYFPDLDCVSLPPAPQPHSCSCYSCLREDFWQSSVMNAAPRCLAQLHGTHEHLSFPSNPLNCGSVQYFGFRSFLFLFRCRKRGEGRVTERLVKCKEKK